jgi:NAD(P)-dependent dehydrogenase (short-subunit alcohol dehydrogenase family)
VTAAPHAVVTGCSSGIGHAIATALLASGWRVTGLSRRSPDLPMPTTAAEDDVEGGASVEGAVGTRLGGGVVPGAFAWLAADLSQPDALPSLLEDVGPTDAVVHAAGFMTTARLGELDPAALRGMFAVHVEAASALVDALSGRILDGGRVVLIGSRTMTGVAGKSHYAATKSALAGLGRSWAIELAPRGITCNIVAPGPTDTPMLTDPGRAGVPPKVPALGRLVDPADVAQLVAFLLGPHGSSITGQTLTICGGASLSA